MPAPTPTPGLRRAALAAILLLAAAGPAHADWRDEVGHTRLLQTYTSGVPTAVAAGVTQAEAGDKSGNLYLPNVADSRFAGKTIFNKSTGTGSSGHATGVGAYFYGSTGSLLPDTLEIDAYNATHWLNSLPYAETRRVQNHSWVVHTLEAGSDPDATVRYFNARLDYLVNQNGVVCVAGVNNGQSTTLPYLLAQGYNLISVGLSNGQHSAGLTAYDTAGRSKPDLVAPDSVTSNATPQVASAAGLLAQKLSEAPYSLTGASLPRVVKALLLTGATKDPFPAWSRTDTRPIDARHGAGQLNILLAYRNLLGGRSTYNQLAPDTAWAHEAVRSTLGESRRTYFFDVPAGAVSSRFVATLVWHRAVSGSPLTGYVPSMENLDLALHSVAPDTFTVGAALQTSASTVDNLEHIHLPDLPAGRYALRVSSASSVSTDYALAWRTLPAVTVVATSPVARELDGAPAVFTVARTGPTTGPLLVPLVWGGSAVSGVHYNSAPASLLIPAGAASATVEIAPVADSLAQGDRSLTLAVASDFSLSAGTPANAAATIQDKPFDAWRHARFDSAQLADATVSGAEADPDADGLANLLEYALAAEPLAVDAASRRPASGLDAEGRLTLTYLHAAGRADLGYAVEWTADLAAGGWQSGPAVVTETARVAAEDGELVTVRAETTPAVAPRQFLRLRVTRP